jgi:transcriptional repressor of dcmA and dcmR
MEQLLKIREAARILHVTETTIRRWTNTGLLNCYRIGRKRERRFKMDDLKQYLQSVNDYISRQTAHLGYKDLDVPGGAHMAHLSLDAAESLEIGVAYISKGLHLGETVLIVAPVQKAESLLKALNERGVNSDASLQSGMLRVSEGMDSPASQIAYIARNAENACGGLRIFGEMVWMKNKGWSPADMRTLEDSTGAIAIAGANLLLCQYPLESFPAATAMMAMETHEYTLYKGALVASPYIRKNDLAA